MDYHRRVSTGLPPQNAVPPAPPLPPKGTREHAPKAGLLDRFQGILGGARRSATGPQIDSPHEVRSQLLYSERYGSSSSRTTSHRTGLRIRALDINQARTHVVLAGGKILKTLRVDGANCVEDFNIRSAAVNYAWEATAQHGNATQRPSEDLSSVQRETFDIEDVAWSNGPNFSSHIATAASNGRIMLYDLDRPGVEVGRLHEHNRQVHKVDFNPIEGRFLLSGSQDGTVRLWDLRTLQRNVMICYSRDTFPGRNDGVRHTKWSPTNTWTFALGTDNGTVQRWDTRQNKTPVLKISAHSDTCNTIDWHPDGKHLVSAGKDQNVKVWNLASDRRQKPSFQIRAPKEVQNVRWRPPSYVSQGLDNYVKQSTYLATSYKAHPLVHVWDLRRPFMPFREIYHGINSGTTDMLWQSKDLLWTVGPEGEFCQTDVPFALKTVDRRPLQSLAHSPTAELSFFTQPLASDPAPLVELNGDEFTIEEPRSGDSSSPTKQAQRQTHGDDSFEEKFLSTKSHRKHSRTPSVKSARSFGSTPPTAEDFAKPVIFLDETMREYDEIAPHQISVSGPSPGVQGRQVFTYLTQRYFAILLSREESKAQKLQRICAAYAETLRKAGHETDAQVWKLLGFEISAWLGKRMPGGVNGQANDSLANPDKKILPHRSNLTSAAIAKRIISHDSPNTTRAPSIKGQDSTSNVPTPLVRPVKILSPGQNHSLGDHGDIDAMEQLPPSLNPAAFSQAKTSYPEESVRNSFDSGEGWKPSDSAEERRQDLMSQYRAQPRALLDFDQYQPNSLLTSADFPPHLNRQDSGDSFLMFSTSSGSHPRLSAQNSFMSSIGASVPKEGDSWNGSEHRGMEASQRSPDADDHALFEASYNLSDNRSSNTPEEVTGKLSGSFGSPMQAPNLRGMASDTADAHDMSRDTVFQVANQPSASSDPLVFIDSPRQSPHGQSQPTKNSELSTLAASAASSAADLSMHVHLSLDEETWFKIDMFSELLERYALVSNAQLAAHVFILCRPVLVHALEFLQTPDPDLLMHHPVLGPAYSHLTLATGFSPATARDIVSDTHLVLEEIGISSIMVEAFLSTYHMQLLSHKLYNSAATLRQIAYPAFPAVYEQSLQSIDTGLLCTHCNNPLNNPVDKTVCETCKKSQAPCPVCLLPASPFDLPPSSRTTKKSRRSGSRPTTSTPLPASPQASPVPSSLEPSASDTGSSDLKARLYTSCSLCNHALHTACAYTWFADPVGGGACPIEACLCDCTSGSFRDEKLAASKLQAEIKRGLFPPGGTRTLAGRSSGARPSPNAKAGAGTGTSPGSEAGMSVRRDEWDVGQSRAVRSVRGALRDGAQQLQPAAGPGAGLSSSMSDTALDRERPASAGHGRRRPARGLGGRSSSGRGSEGAQGGQGSIDGKRVRVVGPTD